MPGIFLTSQLSQGIVANIFGNISYPHNSAKELLLIYAWNIPYPTKHSQGIVANKCLEYSLPHNCQEIIANICLEYSLHHNSAREWLLIYSGIFLTSQLSQGIVANILVCLEYSLSHKTQPRNCC